MSDLPPEFGWSLPHEDSPLSPPQTPGRTPSPFAPPSATPTPPDAPAPTPGFGGQSGQYIPGPLTADQYDAITPVPIPEPTPMWKRWWFITALIIVVGGGGALIYANSREDNARDTAADTGVTLDEVTIADSILDNSILISIPDLSIPPLPSLPEFSIPEITIPGLTRPPVPTVPGASSPPATSPGTVAVVGEIATFEDGTMVRLNSVTPNAPPVQDLFPVDDGDVLTRVDFEACAGPAGFSSLNPLYWTGSLDDGTEAEAFLFSFDIIVLQLAPGACVRGQVDLQAPAARTVTTVAVRDTTFQEAARWDTTSSVAVSGPLAPANPVDVTPVGQPVSFGDGATATVKSVTSNVGPLDPTFPADEGRQLVRIDVEVCAGSSSLFASPQNFFGSTTDSQIGAATFLGSTFASVEIAAGQCGSGLIDIDVAAGSTIADIIFSDESTIEAARWRVG